MHGPRISYLIASTAAILLAMSGALALASPTPATQFPFPITDTQLWLTPQLGQVSGSPAHVMLLVPDVPMGATATNDPMIPILEQLGVSTHQASWFGATAWNASREIFGDG